MEEDKNFEENSNENTIIVYTTPTCMYCNMLKAFLDEKEVSYETIDVAENQDKAKYIAEKTRQLGVPVLEVDGEFIIGFDQVKITEVLGLD